MSDAFSNGASAVAYISVAGTAASSSYNFLRDFASAPQELQSFLDTFDVAQTTIQAFQSTLTQVRNVGFVVGHDAWKALKLATDVANDVNIFLGGLTDGDDTKLTLWKKLEIAIKQKDLLKYSEKLQNATVHILAVQQTICCGFQLKLLELSQRSAAVLVEVQENAASAASVSELSTEVCEIRHALSASITALGSDIQTSIHQAFTELKLQSATKTDLLALTQKLDQAILSLDSEIRALLDIEPIARKYLAIDQDVACIREEASNLTNKIVLIASRLESLGQGLADVKSRFPAANEILDRLETLAVDMAVVKSATVDKLWIMQEKLQKLARAMEDQEGISNVSSSKAPNSSKPSLRDSVSDKSVTSVEAVAGNLFMHGISATEGSRGRSIAEVVMQTEQNESGSNTSQNSKRSLSNLFKTRDSYLGTGLQQELGSQCPTLESSRRSDAEDTDFHWHASKEQIIRLDALNKTTEDTNCVSSITQERQELSSSNRNSSTSSFSSVSSTASIGSIFSVLSTSSMSSVASDHGLDTIARLLTQDSIIMSLCIEAVAIHGHEKFERSLRRLLLTFSRNLGIESESPSQKVAARFIRLRARRTARLVSQSVGYTDKQASHSDPQFSSKSSQMFTLFENLSIDEVPSDYSDSDDDLEIDASEFEKMTEYALNSKAFQKLREDLGSLVSQDKKATTIKSITKPIRAAPDHIYDPCTAHSDISCQYLSIIRSSIPSSLDADEQSSQTSDCKAVHEIETHFGSDSYPRNIGLERMNEVLCAITRPICKTYRIWLPAIVGGWLGYMLHEFRSSERQDQSG